MLHGTSVIALWLMNWTLSNQAWPQALSLEQRIQAQSLQIDSDLSQRKQLQLRLDFLRSLSVQLGRPESCAPTRFDESFLDAAEGFYAKIKEHALADVDPIEVWNLSRYIEDHVDEWRAHPKEPIKPYDLKHSAGGQQSVVDFDLDDHGRLFVDFHLPPYSGGFGNVYRLFGYRTRANAAKKVMKMSKAHKTRASLRDSAWSSVGSQSAQQLGALHREQAHLARISTLDAPLQVGLVDTFTVKNAEILQLLYDEDLRHALEATHTGGKHPEQSRILELFQQLGRGLDTLHRKLGMIHADIKPDNILLAYPEDATGITRAVHADFGLSYLGTEALKENSRFKPLVGTRGYTPPEHHAGWIGRTANEKIQNAQKGDVFALSVSLAEALRPHLLSWRRCGDPGAASFQKCFRAMEDLFWRQDAQKPDSVSSFLLSGMSSDLAKRPTAEQWYTALDRVVSQQKAPLILSDPGPSPSGKPADPQLPLIASPGTSRRTLKANPIGASSSSQNLSRKQAEAQIYGNNVPAESVGALLRRAPPSESELRRRQKLRESPFR